MMAFTGEIKAYYAYDNLWVFTKTDTKGSDVALGSLRCAKGEVGTIVDLLTHMTDEQQDVYIATIRRMSR